MTIYEHMKLLETSSDPHVWARAFVAAFTFNPHIASDEDMLACWFEKALQRNVDTSGMDLHCRKCDWSWKSRKKSRGGIPMYCPMCRSKKWNAAPAAPDERQAELFGESNELPGRAGTEN